MNKELKIAIILGVILVTLCLLIVIVSGNKKTQELDIKVYKLERIDGDTTKKKDQEIKAEDYQYVECKINTDEMIEVYRDLKKVYNLDESSAVANKKIVGYYKVASKSETYAFDIAEKGEEQTVYRGDTGLLYKYNSSTLQTIANICK
jgi:hypothetical protein